MQQLTLNDNSVIEILNTEKKSYKLYFNYNTTRQGWFVDIISDDFKVCGIRINCFSNILKNFAYKLKFSLAVIADDELDPFFKQDFLSERAKIYLLEPADLDAQQTIENTLMDIYSDDY